MLFECFNLGKFNGLEVDLHLPDLLLLNQCQSTAIITGFYASQLLCLYRRQRLGLETSRCYYSKYVLKTSQSIHQNVKYLLTPAGQSWLIPALPKLECPFKKRAERKLSVQKRHRIIDDELSDFKHFADPGYNQYERFFQADTEFNDSKSSNLYNINNNTTNIQAQKDLQKDGKKDNPTTHETAEEKENAAIDEAIRQLAHIVGELEYQMGVESFSAGSFDDAFDHFKVSTHHNHPSGVFNLALCYEQGVGVKKNLKTAKRLYEIASELGHAKAFYNLGVFYAQGLGGVHKSFLEAKKNFEKAADLGSQDAIQALSLLLPPQTKITLNNKFLQEDKIFFNDKLMRSRPVSAIANHNLMRVAVS